MNMFTGLIYAVIFYAILCVFFFFDGPSFASWITAAIVGIVFAILGYNGSMRGK